MHACMHAMCHDDLADYNSSRVSTSYGPLSQRCSDDLLRDLPSTAVACAYLDSVNREPLCRQQLMVPLPTKLKRSGPAVKRSPYT